METRSRTSLTARNVVGDKQQSEAGRSTRGSVSVLRAALIYFALVFGVGFCLGPIRVLLLEPRLGATAAELIEAPLMLTTIYFAGRWVGHRFCSGLGGGARFAVGLMAAALVLGADLGVGGGLRGMTVVEVLRHRDRLTGSVYYASVIWMALAPRILGSARQVAGIPPTLR